MCELGRSNWTHQSGKNVILFSEALSMSTILPFFLDAVIETSVEIRLGGRTLVNTEELCSSLSRERSYRQWEAPFARWSCSWVSGKGLGWIVESSRDP